eukprot:1699108-Ditylum_brightwellii.AAC.1
MMLLLGWGWGDLGLDGVAGGWRVDAGRVGVNLEARVSGWSTEKLLRWMVSRSCWKEMIVMSRLPTWQARQNWSTASSIWWTSMVKNW